MIEPETPNYHTLKLTMSSDNFRNIKSAINAISEGRVVIVVDDEDRENEGDFIAAADKVTPEMINFMATHGRGLICVPILEEVAERLKLQAACEDNTSLHKTAFTVSVDATACTTGISAQERALTVQTLAKAQSKPEDLARPGHMFPIISQGGGVLRRAGHTEAACDLARMAGLQPMGLLCEIMDTDGQMARRDRLLEISKEFDCPIISIEELIKYRRRHEKLVARQSTCQFPTQEGEFTLISYDVKYEQQEPFALILGDLAKSDAPLVRMHASCFTCEALNSIRGGESQRIRKSLARIAKEGAGALVYLPRADAGCDLKHWIKTELSTAANDNSPYQHAESSSTDIRDYGVGIQILKDLGLGKIRLLTNHPKPTEDFIFDGYDLEVVDQTPLED